MHTASIDTEKTAPGRAYAELKRRAGEWVGHWELSQVVRSTAVATHLSNVRMLCPAGEVVETKQRKVGGEVGWYSRWRPVGVEEACPQMTQMGADSRN